MSDYQQVEILLVEDSPEDAELTLRAFRKRKLVNQIHHVDDGAAALDFLLARGAYSGRDPERGPRVVLLDLKLPKVSGLEVLRRMRQEPNLRATPVVVVTSSKNDRDLHEAYLLGANSYVVKPVEFEQFSEAMEHLGMYWALLNQVPPKP